MTTHDIRLQVYCAHLFFSWFNEHCGRNFVWEPPQPFGDAYPVPIAAADGRYRLYLLFDRLYETDAEPGWEEQRDRLAERLAAEGPAGLLIWVPPGGALPFEEPAALDFVTRVTRAAAMIEPGGRTDVLLPATVYLGKVREEGAYVSVVGGLSPYWTHISDRVRGAYHLDSTQLKRLPRSDAWREGLIDRIARAAAGLTLAETVEIETEQAWTLQRIEASDGVAFVAVPPRFDPMDGATVRRTLRRRIVTANDRCAERTADLQGLLLVGICHYLEQEPVTAALRGFDPMVYRNLDFIALAADGDLKFILPPRSLPWS